MSYQLQDNGIWQPDPPPVHDEESYHEFGFDVLARMQCEHFWYRGRHRFLLEAVRRSVLPRLQSDAPRMIDIGGGVGGWVDHLSQAMPDNMGEIALGDSSRLAMERARRTLPERVQVYLTDMYDLQWESRWDVIFLLDVIEHLQDDRECMVHAARALAPGGMLVVTTPAFQRLWSYNDDLIGHQRRYDKGMYDDLARHAGLELVQSNYFMFFLSPLLVLSRWLAGDVARQTPEERHALLLKAHEVPSGLVNGILGAIFRLETPLGLLIPFPFGSSVLGVFRRPD